MSTNLSTSAVRDLLEKIKKMDSSTALMEDINNVIGDLDRQDRSALRAEPKLEFISPAENSVTPVKPHDTTPVPTQPLPNRPEIFGYSHADFKFSGNPDEMLAEMFIMKIDTLFSLNPGITDNWKAQRALIANSFVGPAANWYLELFSSENPSLLSSVAFWEKFRSTFISPNKLLPLRFELLKLKQHPKETPSQYAVRYGKVARDAKMSLDLFHVINMIQHLNDETWKSLIQCQDWPMELDTFSNLISSFDIRQNRLNMTSSPLIANYGLNDGLASGKRHRSLTDEERNSRYVRGVCVFCGMDGHRAENCPAKQSKNSYGRRNSGIIRRSTLITNPNPNKITLFVHVVFTACLNPARSVEMTIYVHF